MMLATAAVVAGTAWSPRVFAASTVGPGGFSPERLAKIPPALQQSIDQGASVGIVTLIFRHGQVAQVNTLGYQDREAKLPMKRDTIFRIASMSKPVTSVGVQTLIEQGKLGLNDPIDKWLPELANPKVVNGPNSPLTDTHLAPRGITVLDLLTHRSGLTYSFLTFGPLGTALRSLPEVGAGSVDDWLKALGGLPLLYDPGTHWNYGLSYDVLGALIQRVSGRPFVEYLKTAIFDPLGMKDTGFWVPKEKQNRVAAVYGFDKDGSRVPLHQPLSETPPSFASGGGGLVTTADDYLKFARMLLGDGKLGDVRILTVPSVARMRTNWLTPEQRQVPAMGNPEFWASQGFGLGMAVIDDVARLDGMPYGSKGSFSWDGATGCCWQADPVEDMVTLYFVQNAILGGPALPPASFRQGALAFYAPMAALCDLAYEAIET